LIRRTRNPGFRPGNFRVVRPGAGPASAGGPEGIRLLSRSWTHSDRAVSSSNRGLGRRSTWPMPRHLGGGTSPFRTSGPGSPPRWLPGRAGPSHAGRRRTRPGLMLHHRGERPRIERDPDGGDLVPLDDEPLASERRGQRRLEVKVAEASYLVPRGEDLLDLHPIQHRRELLPCGEVRFGLVEGDEGSLEFHVVGQELRHRRDIALVHRGLVLVDDLPGGLHRLGVSGPYRFGGAPVGRRGDLRAGDPRGIPVAGRQDRRGTVRRTSRPAPPASWTRIRS
jgi:hypothetical protein